MSEQSRKYLSIHQPPQNSTVKLFMTQEKIKSWYRHETRREEERFTSSRPEPSRSAWRAEQWGQCLGRVLPPWPSFKEPRSTDGHCLGSDGSEGFSQSVSVLSSWINLCHFWNTQITPSSAVWAVSNLQLSSPKSFHHSLSGFDSEGITTRVHSQVLNLGLSD